MRESTLRRIFIVSLVFSVSILFGCAGYQEVPESPEQEPQRVERVGFIPKALLELDKAIEKAREECKDQDCPEEFYEVLKLRDLAYEMFWECRDCEWLKVAMEARDLADKLCPPKVEAVAPPPAEAKVIDRMTLRINFDFDKSIIRESEKPKLYKAIDFIKQYPGTKIVIEGHTCSIGTEEYNQGLSERRAQSVRRFIIEAGGIDASRITAIGYGETRPAFSNDNDEGRSLNRRDEILILSK